MAADYDRVANAFLHLKDQLVVASVNGDDQRKLAQNFKIAGYPTLLWFTKGSTEPQPYEGGRDFNSIVRFLERKSGLRSAYKSVYDLKEVSTSEEFERFLEDKSTNGIVMFYAPCNILSNYLLLGCGHCQSFKPIFTELGKVFRNERKCKVMLINGDVHRDLMGRYEVTGYPTVKFFPSFDKQKPVNYEGMRKLEDLVEYLNDNCGTLRTADGKLMPEAGVRRDVEEKIKELLSAKEREVLKKLSGEFDVSEDPFVQYYGRLVEANLSNDSFIKSELERIVRLLENEELAIRDVDRDNFTKKRNILNRLDALFDEVNRKDL